MHTHTHTHTQNNAHPCKGRVTKLPIMRIYTHSNNQAHTHTHTHILSHTHKALKHSNVIYRKPYTTIYCRIYNTQLYTALNNKYHSVMEQYKTQFTMTN